MRGAVKRNADLTVALEAALVRELRATWRSSTTRTSAPASSLRRSSSSMGATLGRWIPTTRTIEISRPPRRREALERSSWRCSSTRWRTSTCTRSSARASETPHGPAFRDACARLGVDARASGVPASGTRPTRGARRRDERGPRADRAPPRARGEPEPARGRGRDGGGAAPDAQAQPRGRADPRGARLRLRPPRPADGARRRARAPGGDDPGQALLRRGHLGARSTGRARASAAACSRSAGRTRTSRSRSTRMDSCTGPPSASGPTTSRRARSDRP